MKDEIKEAFEDLSMRAGRMTNGQLDFVKSLRRYYERYKTLSEKQKKVLFDIRSSLKESRTPEFRQKM
ncbi:MAG: hypothetical protein WCE64_16805 [Bacteroidales bacterium]